MESLPESITSQFQSNQPPTLDDLDKLVTGHPVGSKVLVSKEMMSVLLDYFTSMGMDTERLPGGQTKFYAWKNRYVELDPFHD